MGPRARALYNRFEQMIAAWGECSVEPAESRIAFMGRVRFAGITSLSEKGMTCTFSLPFPLDSPRFVKVEEVVPGLVGAHPAHFPSRPTRHRGSGVVVPELPAHGDAGTVG